MLPSVPRIHIPFQPLYVENAQVWSWDYIRLCILLHLRATLRDAVLCVPMPQSEYSRLASTCQSEYCIAAVAWGPSAVF